MEDYDRILDKYCNTIIDDKEKVVGELYLITNNITKKQYVGQTLSHHKNHERYRPFGYLGRFNDHLSEARSRPEKQTYLKNSIRKYGDENFSSQLIKRCKFEEVDDLEVHYIMKYNTLYPNGYNLTVGGKNAIYIPARFDEEKVEYFYENKYRTHQTE
jgi:hypothetical protein